MRKTVRVYLSRQYGTIKHLNKFVSTVLLIVLSHVNEFISFLESHPTYLKDYSRTAKVDVNVIDELVAIVNEKLGEQYTKTDIASLAVKFVFERGYINAVEDFIDKNSITISSDTVSETDTTSVSSGGDIDTTDTTLGTDAGITDTAGTVTRDASDADKCSEEELIKWWWWTVMWVNKRRNLERAREWRKRRSRFTWRKHF